MRLKKELLLLHQDNEVVLKSSTRIADLQKCFCNQLPIHNVLMYFFRGGKKNMSCVVNSVM